MAAHLGKIAPASQKQDCRPDIAAVFMDFDGTICPHDVTDLLLENFAAPAWKQVERDWLAGRIGARECMSRQVGLIKAAPAALAAFLDTVCLDPDFPEFVQMLKRENVPAAIVSDGLDYSIHHILRKYNLDNLSVFSNHLVYCGDESWRLEFPYKNPACPAGHCKCRRYDALPTSGAVVYIGDGASDFCPAAKADIVFAKGKLADFCAKRQIEHIEIQNFADVARHWPHLALPQAGRPAARARVAS